MLSILFILRFEHQGFKLGLCFVDFAHKIVVYCLDAYEMVIRDDIRVETMLNAQCCVRQMPMIGSFLSHFQTSHSAHLALHFPLRMFYERNARLQLIAAKQKLFTIKRLQSFISTCAIHTNFDLFRGIWLRVGCRSVLSRPFVGAYARYFDSLAEFHFGVSQFAYKIKTM